MYVLSIDKRPGGALALEFRRIRRDGNIEEVGIAAFWTKAGRFRDRIHPGQLKPLIEAMLKYVSECRAKEAAATVQLAPAGGLTPFQLALLDTCIAVAGQPIVNLSSVASIEAAVRLIEKGL